LLNFYNLFIKNRKELYHSINSLQPGK